MVLDDIPSIAAMMSIVSGFVYWRIKAHEDFDKQQFDELKVTQKEISERLEKFGENMVLAGHVALDFEKLEKRVDGIESRELNRKEMTR
jgi:hypothetical protein